MIAPVAQPACRVAAPRITAPQKAAGALVASFAAASLAVSPAFATPDLALGREVFDGNCAACHMGGGNTVRPEATLAKIDIEQYLQTPVGNGLKLEAIQYQVINGKGGMPAWGDRLDEDEIESVSAYVFDQASNSKW